MAVLFLHPEDGARLSGGSEKKNGRSGKRFAQGGKAVGDAAMRHTPSRPERSNSREWGDALTKQARSLQQGLGLANDFPL